MAKCVMCDKVGHSGNNVSHSKRRTKTRFMLNIQRATLEIKGKRKRVAVCTRCLRSYHRIRPQKAAAQ